MTCDDCVCTGRCVFVTSAEQPYFQAYRLAFRLPVGEPWRGVDYVLWIGSMWSAWRRMNGIAAFHPLTAKQHAEFKAWLFARVGHPAAAPQLKAA